MPRRKQSRRIETDRAFIIECLDVYKTLPALWDPTNIYYGSEIKKAEGFKILVGKFREKYPRCVLADVSKKINALCANFRTYLKSIASGKKPRYKLWYFDNMKFLCDEKKKRERALYEEYIDYEKKPDSFESDPLALPPSPIPNHLEEDGEAISITGTGTEDET